MINKLHKVLKPQQLLSLSILTVITSFIFGLGSAVLYDVYKDFDTIAHFLAIKAVVSGIVSLGSLIHYFETKEKSDYVIAQNEINNLKKQLLEAKNV